MIDDKDKVWFKLSGQVTPNMEEAMLAKYESKETAILYWWGHTRGPWDDDWWELCVVKYWVDTRNKNGTIE